MIILAIIIISAFAITRKGSGNISGHWVATGYPKTYIFYYDDITLDRDKRANLMNYLLCDWKTEKGHLLFDNIENPDGPYYIELLDYEYKIKDGKLYLHDAQRDSDPEYVEYERGD